jgi:Icc-related predicted phosphoesterase
MNILCMSDLHGHLMDLPKADILLIGGDICPLKNHSIGYQANWINTTFSKWVASLDITEVFVVAGNHDFVFEQGAGLLKRGLPFTYLQDRTVISKEGLIIHGSPWQKRFYDWAFNADEDKLAMAWEMIPSNTDILLLHGPPYGYGDLGNKVYPDKDDDSQWPKTEHCGSPSLTDKIIEIQPKLVVYGHIHPGRGKYTCGQSVLLNSSIVDCMYQPCYLPWNVTYNSGKIEV